MTHHPADHGGLEILPFERCLELLAAVPVGRVSFFADGEIVVLPVNHVMDGPDPVFRTARGSKLSAAEGQNVVAFEADGYDERTRTGWSVLVNGRAHAVYEAAEIRRLNRLGLRPWVSAANRPFWIRIRPATISGRRIPDPDPDADADAGHERLDRFPGDQAVGLGTVVLTSELAADRRWISNRPGQSRRKCPRLPVGSRHSRTLVPGRPAPAAL